MQSQSTLTFPQIEASPINRRQKILVTAAALGTMLEFFDFFVIAYVLNIIAKPWGLTVGESGFLLMSAGAASIIGAIGFGALADRIGRRRVFQATVLTFSLATGAMALVPEGNWLLLSLLRFVVGLGVGGLVVVDVPLIQEFVGSRYRGLLGGMIVWFVPMGSILGSVSAAFLGPIIGWRGLVMIGLLPAFISLYVRFNIKESPTWLMSRGRDEEARESVAWVMDINPAQVDLPTYQAPEKARWTEQFKYPRSVAFTWLNSFFDQTAFYGIMLWGPALLAITFGKTPAEAARLWIIVSVVGLLGRIVGSRLSDLWGRRRTGIVFTSIAVAFLVATAFSGSVTIGSLPAFFVFLVIGWFFLDGLFTVALPYWSEHFPTRIRATGTGAAYGIGGLGKVIGPAILVLISGVGTAVDPKATSSAIQPAFLMFAAAAFVALLSYVFLAIETRGLNPDQLEETLERQRGDALHSRVQRGPSAAGVEGGP